MLYALLFLLQNRVKYLILYTVDEEKSTSTNNFISRPPHFPGAVWFSETVLPMKHFRQPEKVATTRIGRGDEKSQVVV